VTLSEEVQVKCRNGHQLFASQGVADEIRSASISVINPDRDGFQRVGAVRLWYYLCLRPMTSIHEVDTSTDLLWWACSRLSVRIRCRAWLHLHLASRRSPSVRRLLHRDAKRNGLPINVWATALWHTALKRNGFERGLRREDEAIADWLNGNVVVVYSGGLFERAPRTC
jgi:hypothetical protein